MNFTNLKHFLSDNVQTVLLLVGFILIAIAISFLTNIYYGLLALGVECILVALMINYEKGG